MKRAYKLQEFVAHTCSVNCLQVGRKSAGVLVTGGEDKKVNVWAIGKPTAVLSLSGHQSAVECVSFDAAEEVVVAGASGGTVKIWDLEQAKVTRTLTGHRSSCLSVDFHPFGDFFASGSLDTTLKVWDVRRKACISTYRSHSRGVTNTRFSPDGRLLASGGQDGEVKVWDLTAGKLLHSFCHTDAITGLEFHPSEFVLATGSADRIVKWWDLETSELIDTAGPETAGVRSIAFPANGDCLLAAVQDGLRVWAYEPVRRLDIVEVPWSKVRDMSLNEQDGKLVACSCNNSFVGVWVVDLDKIRPWSGPAVRKAPASQSHEGNRHSSRVSTDATASTASPAASPAQAVGRSNLFPLEQQRSPIAGLGQLPVDSLQQDTNALSPALIRATRAPQLRNSISRMPTAPQASHSGAPAQAYHMSAQPDSQMPTPPQASHFSTPSQSYQMSAQLDSPISAPHIAQLALSASPLSHAAGIDEAQHAHKQASSASASTSQHFTSSDASALPSSNTQQQQMPQMSCSAPEAAPHDMPDDSADASAAEHAQYARETVGAAQQSPATPGGHMGQLNSGSRNRVPQLSPEPTGRVAESCFDRPQWSTQESSGRGGLSPGPSGLDMDAFLPPGLSPRQGHDVSEDAVMAELMAKHQTVMSVLSSRQATMQIVKGFWFRGDVKGALTALLQSSDASVAMDVFTVIRNSPQLLQLENCCQIVSCLQLLLVSAYPQYVQTAVETAFVVLRTFGEVITQTCQEPLSSIGVDLSYEDRRSKCQTVKTSLKQLSLSLQRLQHVSEPLQSKVHNLIKMLTAL